MYFTYTGLPGYTIPGGTDVLGATSLGTQYDFGYIDTSTGHDTWLTMLNQQSTATTIHAQFFPAAGGAPVTHDFSAPANSRYTVHVNTDVPGLGAGSYSALITLSQPSFVERPMYFKDTGTGYTGSADVIGTGAPRSAWYFAEGYTSSAFHERYVVSNPNSTGTANVTLAFLKGDGTTQSTGPLTLPPGQQQVVDANLILGSGGVNNSAVVTSTGATILAERVMSFDYTGPVGTVGSSNIQGASDVLGAGAPGQTFLFAEGYSGGQFGEWLTLENPGPTQSTTVTVRYLPDNGSTPTLRQYVVGPTTRFTVFTNSEMPNQSFSMAVTSTLPIVAERPMYFNYQGRQQGGSDVIGYQP
jgi:hypothetical protein